VTPADRLWHIGFTGAAFQALSAKEVPMQTLDEMLSLNLLTADQHQAIGAWVRQARTPERILQMPPPLWAVLEQATTLLDFDGSGPPH